jgi:hypothetical protein
VYVDGKLAPIPPRDEIATLVCEWLQTMQSKANSRQSGLHALPTNFAAQWHRYAEESPMLNIRRKRGETIHVGKDIQIKVLDLFKASVLIGVNAPKESCCRRVGNIDRRRSDGAWACFKPRPRCDRPQRFHDAAATTRDPKLDRRS